MRIDGQKTFLVPFSEAHLNDPAYEGWLRDRDVMRYIGRDEYFAPFEFSMVVDYVKSVWENPFCTFWAVHALDRAFVGTFKVNYGDETGRRTATADIGIMIGARDRWGGGLATDVLATGCAHVFEVEGARKLTAGANATNEAVGRAFERVGFRREGLLRRKLLVDGAYHDHLLLGCFPNELVDPRR